MQNTHACISNTGNDRLALYIYTVPASTIYICTSASLSELQLSSNLFPLGHVKHLCYLQA